MYHSVKSRLIGKIRKKRSVPGPLCAADQDEVLSLKECAFYFDPTKC